MPGLMQQGKDSTVGTIVVALAVCLVCSVIVSFAAVTLRPIQDTNKTQDFKRNILSVVGMLDPSRPIDEQFSAFETRVINFDTGEYAPEMNTEEFDQRKSSKDPELSINLTAEQDMADIKRRENYGQVFLVRNDDDSIRFMVLPVRGYGLWSTLYGFLALEGDGKTIVGLSFYEHAETPGLGGEVDNPKWKAQWRGKLLLSLEGLLPRPLLRVARPRFFGLLSFFDTTRGNRWRFCRPTRLASGFILKSQVQKW